MLASIPGSQKHRLQGECMAVYGEAAALAADNLVARGVSMQ